MSFPDYLGMTGTDTFSKTNPVSVKILGSTRNGKVLFFCKADESTGMWSTMFAKFFEADPGQNPCGNRLPIFGYSDQDPHKKAKIDAWKKSQGSSPNTLGSACVTEALASASRSWRPNNGASEARGLRPVEHAK